jgi:hypothetical protein
MWESEQQSPGTRDTPLPVHSNAAGISRPSPSRSIPIVANNIAIGKRQYTSRLKTERLVKHLIRTSGRSRDSETFPFVLNRHSRSLHLCLCVDRRRDFSKPIFCLVGTSSQVAWSSTHRPSPPWTVTQCEYISFTSLKYPQILLLHFGPCSLEVVIPLFGFYLSCARIRCLAVYCRHPPPLFHAGSGPDSALPGGVFVTRRLLNLPWVIPGAAPRCPTGILPDPVLACVASGGFFWFLLSLCLV